MSSSMFTNSQPQQQSWSSAPAKYIKVNGIPKLNPQYTQWQQNTGQATSSLTPQHQNIALPVVTSMDDYAAYNEAAGQDRKMAASMEATFDIIQEKGFAAGVGMSPGNIMDEIGAVFGKLEIPLGLVSKLMELQMFDNIEFLVDDSGSMSSRTDSNGPNGRPMSRWEEARERIKTMIEIMAYVPIPVISLYFLNNAQGGFQLTRSPSQSPQVFLTEALRRLEAAFSRGPTGTTPFKEKIQDSLNRYPTGKRVIRYFLGDGQPNGGKIAIDAIVKMIRLRPNPQDNPITFISCTDQDEDVEWMKECEEVAPYCSELDDYEDEKREVLKDQGLGLPFTKGFYLIALIVAALNPEDLDAMDESCPMTKFTLDNLLGLQYSREEYMVYFDHFIQAQEQKLRQQDTAGGHSFTHVPMNWKLHANTFLTAEVPAGSLPFVKEYKQRFANAYHGVLDDATTHQQASSVYNSGTSYHTPWNQGQQQQPYQQGAGIYNTTQTPQSWQQPQQMNAQMGTYPLQQSSQALPPGQQFSYYAPPTQPQTQASTQQSYLPPPVQSQIGVYPPLMGGQQSYPPPPTQQQGGQQSYQPPPPPQLGGNPPPPPPYTQW